MGLRFKVYYALQRADQDGYKFYEIGTINQLDASFSTSVSFTSAIQRGINVGNFKDKVWKGAIGSKKVQFYPRPTTADKTVAVSGAERELSFFHLRYLFKPSPLVDDYDVPLIPAAFHHLIVNKALTDIHSKFGNDSASLVAERKFEEGMKKLDARFASERDTLLVRSQSQSFGRKFGRNQFPYTPLVTYEG
jgi:hypothetical protein